MSAGGWDVHTHLVPPTLLTAPGLGQADGRLTVDGRPTVPLGSLTDPAALAGWVTDQRLAGALVSLPPALLRYDLAAAEAVGWADRANTALAEALAGDPRLRPLATMPLADPVAAAATAAAALDRDGFAGLVLGTLPDSPDGYADPAFTPLWRVLDERAGFVFLHPGNHADSRLDAFYLGNLLGNPYETTVAAAQLLFGGVLSGYPSITFCLAHGGGFLAAAAGRWQRGLDTRRPGVPAGAGPIRPALRRLLVDDLVYDQDALALLEATFGVDRVVAGSDWPFPIAAERVDQVRACRTAGLVERLTRPR